MELKISHAVAIDRSMTRVLRAYMGFSAQVSNCRKAIRPAALMQSINQRVSAVQQAVQRWCVIISLARKSTTPEPCIGMASYWANLSLRA